MIEPVTKIERNQGGCYFEIRHNEVTCEISILCSEHVPAGMLLALAQSIAAGINAGFCIAHLSGTAVAECDRFYRQASIRYALPLQRSDRRKVAEMTRGLVRALHGESALGCPVVAYQIPMSALLLINGCLKNELHVTACS